MIQELDLVALLTDRPETGLRRGDVGTIVHIYGQSQTVVVARPTGDLYEVEFMDANGRTISVETLSSDEVRAVDLGRVILHYSDLDRPNGLTDPQQGTTLENAA